LDRLMRIASNSTERETVSRFASSLLTPHVQGLGRTAKPKEPQSQTLMRTSVLEALGRWAPDAQLEREAARVAANFVRGRKDIDQEQLQLLLPIAAQSGDAALHAAFSAQLKTASPGVRVALLVALGHFTDPKLLQQSYAALLDGTVLLTERNFLFHGAMESEVSYAVFWDWYRQHEATLIQRAGERTVSEFPALAAFMCTPAGRDEARRHFADVARYGAASETILREAMETAERCIALRERYSADLVSGLNAR
jgi:alanyl aminopeptidase